ncbi:MAG: Gfo/Idh/MocA family oxidoreductase [Phycisphaerales bacterium]|nr:Gfo/Idh/MocA family oxidoreductase [Phycisphaerales bacterium]
MELGIGIIGLGFMGRTHLRAYRAAAAAGLPCRVVAVCDRSAGAESAGRGNLATGEPVDLSGARVYRDAAALLADPGVGAVSVCTYTDTHASLAEAALAAGRHVLVEKPVALASAAVRRLDQAAVAAGRVCMPAMCMRFWPGWDWLRDRVVGGELGAVRSVALQRLGAGPGWATEFYRDESRSGGCLFDLHVHDVDFLYWCFGRPRTVSCAGGRDHFTTSFHFDGGPPHVTAEAAWDLAPGAGFRMRYTATFEHATAEWDLARTPPLPALLVHHFPGRGAPETEAVPQPPGTGYEAEAAHFAHAVLTGRGDVRATLADAAVVTEILEAAAASRASGRPVTVFQ